MPPTNCYCSDLHDTLRSLQVFRFPFDVEQIPRNGVYVLYEEGESGHSGNRIVRVGTHTGDNQLRSRLQQHFLRENKDRSIFRKNIGRALLNGAGDPFLRYWELDLTTRKMKEQYADVIDRAKQLQIEQQVSKYIQDSFSFVVLPISGKEERLHLESRMISTVSWCGECQPSKGWLGHSSTKRKIRESGLWLVNQLYKEPLSEADIKSITQIVSSVLHSDTTT